MNEFIEYVCRGVIRSEDAVKRLNRSVASLAKSSRITNTRVTCIALAGLGVIAVITMQDKEIRELKKQVADLVVKDEPEEGSTENTADNTEEQNEQEGA